MNWVTTHKKKKKKKKNVTLMINVVDVVTVKYTAVRKCMPEHVC